MGAKFFHFFGKRFNRFSMRGRHPTIIVKLPIETNGDPSLIIDTLTDAPAIMGRDNGLNEYLAVFRVGINCSRFNF